MLPGWPANMIWITFAATEQRDHRFQQVPHYKRSSLMADSASDSSAMSKLNGSFHRDASNRLTYDICAIESERYPELCNELAAIFELKPVSELVVGLDEMFRDYTNGHVTIGLEWDIWSGFIVVAKDVESEQLVRQIGDYLTRTDYP